MSAQPTGSAWLVDMEGQVVHHWISTFGQPPEEDPIAPWAYGWDHVEIGPDGDLYAIIFDSQIIKLDWQSNVIWNVAVPAHHDFDFDAEGNLVTIGDHIRSIDNDRAILDQQIVTIAPNGSIVDRISLFDALDRDPQTRLMLQQALAERFNRDLGLLLEQLERDRTKPVATSVSSKQKKSRRELLRESVATRTVQLVSKGLSRAKSSPEAKHDRWTLAVAHNSFMDLFHTNTIEVMDRAEPGLWDAGDFLVSMRHLDLVAVIGATTKQVRWHWGPGQLQGQHMPSQTKTGRILVFDNGRKRKPSRLVQIDPRANEIVWTYQSPRRIASAGWGSVQELPNGNMLSIDPFKGRAYQITPDGTIVWEYLTPLRTPGHRYALYRMRQYPETVLAGREPVPLSLNARDPGAAHN